MGLSVWNQVDNSKYFCLSSINKKILAKNGINIPLSQFKEIVKRTPPYTKILTGSSRCLGHHRKTNIYRYEDFVKTIKSGGG